MRCTIRLCRVVKEFVLRMFFLGFLLLYLCSDFCIGGDPYYVAEWSDVIKSCPDFDNTHFTCDDISLGSSAGDDDEGGLSISGHLTFLEDMEDGITVDLEILKSTELGDEPLYSARADFCSSLKNPDTPWFPLVTTFNSTSCPIRKNKYSLDGLKISLEFAKDVLNHENCGEYTVQMAMMNTLDMISCHILRIAVVEKYNDE